jgi:leucyl aminopeptidase
MFEWLHHDNRSRGAGRLLMLKYISGHSDIASEPDAAIALPCFEGREQHVEGLWNAYGNSCAMMPIKAGTRGFTAKKGQVIQLDNESGQPVFWIGMGLSESVTPEIWRTFAQTAVESANKVNVPTLILFLPSSEVETGPMIQQCVIGAEFEGYSFIKYHSKPKPKTCASVHLAMSNIRDEHLRAFLQGSAQANGMTAALDLVNEPPNCLTTIEFGNRVQKLEELPHVTATVRDADWIKKNGLNLLYAVGKGREDAPPVFGYAVYRPPGASKDTPSIMLVGKGMTYDAGGQVSKPGPHSQGMKGDMAGAASMFGAFLALVAAECKYIVHLVIPMADNANGGNCMRVDDVYWSYARRKSVEIVHSDAEGRLILADALAWGEIECQPDMILDLATLTGAQVVAHGDQIGSVMSRNPELIEALRGAAAASGEKLEPLPLDDSYMKALVEDSVADIRNLVPGEDKSAGTARAGTFVSAFVEDTPHAHVDGAGPLLGKTSGNLGTGWLVPTLFAFGMSDAPARLKAAKKLAA